MYIYMYMYTHIYIYKISKAISVQKNTAYKQRLNKLYYCSATVRPIQSFSHLCQHALCIIVYIVYTVPCTITLYSLFLLFPLHHNIRVLSLSLQLVATDVIKALTLTLSFIYMSFCFL